MTVSIHDLVGTIGVALIVGSYFLLQVGRVQSSSLGYSLANAAGAALILVSLVYDFNFSAFVVELFWLLTSVLGAFITLRRRRGQRMGSE